MKERDTRAQRNVAALDADTERPRCEDWVWSSGPPAVRMRTISKLANVTISENSVVIAMMFASSVA